MKYTLQKMLAIIAIAMSANAFAYTNYVTVKGGGTFVPDLSDTQTQATTAGLKQKVEIHHDWQFNFGLAAGMKEGAIRGELEFSWTRLQAKKYIATNLTPKEVSNKKSGYIMRGMINGYYDFHLNMMATPYLGAGVGYAFAKHRYTKHPSATTGDFSLDTNMFAYQLMAGANFQAASNANILLEYRFFGTPSTEFLDKTSAATKSNYKQMIMMHAVNIGATFVIA